MDNPWIEINSCSPPEGMIVNTKISDNDGDRKEQLMYRKGRLWFTRDNVYVYYTPTHWRKY